MLYSKDVKLYQLWENLPRIDNFSEWMHAESFVKFKDNLERLKGQWAEVVVSYKVNNKGQGYFILTDTLFWFL